MINRVILFGRILRDPTARESTRGVKYADTTIAVDKRVRSMDPNVPKCDFFRVVAFGQVAQYLEDHGAKGHAVSIDGYLRTRSFVDSHGQNREMVEIVAEQATLLAPAHPTASADGALVSAAEC